MATPSVRRPRALGWLDYNVETTLMLVLYVFIAVIVGGEALWRYLVGVQTQWGGTAAVHAFIFLSWLGCAYHVRRRSHIRFSSIRDRLSRTGQFTWYVVDDILWLVMAVVVIRYSIELLQMNRAMGGTLEGTDTFPYWIAVAAVPIGWVLIAIRAIQDLVIMLGQYRRGEVIRGL